MTVKELKEILNYFDDSLMILMTSEHSPWYKPCTNVIQGINEMDGYVILDNYSEDD